MSTNRKGAPIASDFWPFFRIWTFRFSMCRILSLAGMMREAGSTSTHRASAVLTAVPYRVKYRVKLESSQEMSEVVSSTAWLAPHTMAPDLVSVPNRMGPRDVNTPPRFNPNPRRGFDLDRHHLRTTISASGLHLIHRRVGFRMVPAPGRMENT